MNVSDFIIHTVQYTFNPDNAAQLNMPPLKQGELIALKFDLHMAARHADCAYRCYMQIIVTSNFNLFVTKGYGDTTNPSNHDTCWASAVEIAVRDAVKQARRDISQITGDDVQNVEVDVKLGHQWNTHLFPTHSFCKVQIEEAPNCRYTLVSVNTLTPTIHL